MLVCAFKAKEITRFLSLWLITAADEGDGVSPVCRKFDFPWNYYMLGNRQTSVSQAWSQGALNCAQF